MSQASLNYPRTAGRGIESRRIFYRLDVVHSPAAQNPHGRRDDLGQHSVRRGRDVTAADERLVDRAGVGFMPAHGEYQASRSRQQGDFFLLAKHAMIVNASNRREQAVENQRANSRTNLVG